MHRPVSALPVFAVLAAVVISGLTAGPAEAASAAPNANTNAAAPNATTPNAAPSTNAPYANVNVCNVYCDGRDPAVAAGDRQVATATVWSRSIVLHSSDGDDMAWASINNGSPTDEVWLDRSFDGGQSWATGSKLGDTTVPAGYGGWRTLMYNADNPSARGVGALRACGKAGDRVEIACTAWARPTTHAGTPTAASATALMQYWNTGIGRWNSAVSSWQDANALTAMIDYIQRTGDSTYAYAIAATYNDNLTSADYTGTYIDDTGWWGLVWLKAYGYTGDARYLQTAEYDAGYMSQYWDGTCGGGVWWSTARTAKNAIANELYLELNAALHLAVPGDSTYLARARQEWAWFAQSGLINSNSLINDGLNLSTCQNDGGWTYTYNQGVILAGLADLYRSTGQSALIATAQNIANAATTRLTTGGILVDPCEAGWCANDGYSFKGIFVRDLREFANTLGLSAYNGFLGTQASSILAKDTDLDGQSGLYWAGPLSAVGFANQQSALDAFTASS
jgi:hypothetical protein